MVSLCLLLKNGKKDSKRQTELLVKTEKESLGSQSYIYLKASILRAISSISLRITFFKKDSALLEYFL